MSSGHIMKHDGLSFIELLKKNGDPENILYHYFGADAEAVYWYVNTYEEGMTRDMHLHCYFEDRA